MKLLAMRFRDMLLRKEFFAALMISTLLFLVPCFTDMLRLFGRDLSGIKPAWYYFGLSLSPGVTYDSPVFVIFSFMLIAPLIAGLAYSCCYFDESRYGARNLLIVREGRRGYYLSSAFTVFAGGFLVIFLPLLISQLVFCAAVPLASYASVSSDGYGFVAGASSYAEDTYSLMQFFNGIAINHPYVFNLIYCVIPAVIFSLIGLLSYSLSLYFKKNKYLCLALPFLLYLILDSMLALSQMKAFSLTASAMPGFHTENLSPAIPVIVVLGLLLVNACALGNKIMFEKDEL